MDSGLTNLQEEVHRFCPRQFPHRGECVVTFDTFGWLHVGQRVSRKKSTGHLPSLGFDSVGWIASPQFSQAICCATANSLPGRVRLRNLSSTYKTIRLRPNCLPLYWERGLPGKHLPSLADQSYASVPECVINAGLHLNPFTAPFDSM